MIPEHFRVTVENERGFHRVTLAGELDLAVARGLAEQIVGSTGSAVEVDLSELTFISAAGVAALLEARSRVQAGGHEMTLRGAAGMVRRVFEILELDGLIEER